MTVERRERYYYQEATTPQLIENLLEQPDTFGLREAASFLDQNGIKISHTMLGIYGILVLEKAIGENDPQLLSPTALAFRGKNPDDKVYTYKYTVSDLKSVFRCLPEFYQRKIPLAEQHRVARERMKEKRRENIDLYQVTQDLWGRSDFAKRRKVEKMLLKGTLPLGEYPFLFANTVGLPEKLYQELKPIWQQKLEEREEKRKRNLRYSRKVQVMKEEGKVYFMGSFLKELFGLEKTSRHTRLAAFYLKRELEPFGIPIEIISQANGIFYYCLIGKDKAEELERFFRQSTDESRRIREKTKDILQNGFQTLRQFQEYCPPDYLISLTQTLRLSGIFISNFVISSMIKEIEECFASFGLEIKKITLGSDKKTGQPKRNYYLSLQDLQQLPDKKRDLRKRLMSLIRAKVLRKKGIFGKDG